MCPQEDGTRDTYQLSFGKIDNDNSKSIEFVELCNFYGYTDNGDELTDWSDPVTLQGSETATGDVTSEGEAAGIMSGVSYVSDARQKSEVADSHESHMSGDSYASISDSRARPALIANPQPVANNAVRVIDNAAHKLTALEVINIFKTLDTNGDGELSHAEFIKGLKDKPTIADKLGMPSDIHAEDGTRESYQLAFGQVRETYYTLHIPD